MITHIVLWTLHEEAEGRTRAENARLAKEKLEALRGQIPGLRHIEVGLPQSDHPQMAHVAMVTHLDSWEALESYQKHPKHQAVLPFMKAIVATRTAADYES